MRVKDAATIACFTLVRGIVWLLATISGLSFFWGGKAIHDVGHVDRLLAELLGLGMAIVCGVSSALLKAHLEG